MKIMRMKMALPLVLLAAVMTMGNGCATFKDKNPVAAGCQEIQAETAALCGYSVYGTFVVFQGLALGVATDAANQATAAQARGDTAAANSAGRIRDSLIAAEENAKPVADGLLAAVANYEQVRADLSAGKTSQEKLAIALVNLQKWVTDAKPLIDKLVTAYSNAKK